MSKNVVICVPLTGHQERERSKYFGVDSRISLVGRDPDRFVIENDAVVSPIPSISTVDRSFQEAEVMPAMIDNAENECNNMNRFIRALISEIERLCTEKADLEREIGELSDKLAAIPQESLRAKYLEIIDRAFPE